MTKRIIILAIVISLYGCTPKRIDSYPNRYQSMSKQTTFVSLRFDLDDKELIGKTKIEVQNLMGEPSQKKLIKEDDVGKEFWIYYPQDTDNFIAIIVTFVGEKVESCAYESVI